LCRPISQFVFVPPTKKMLRAGFAIVSPLYAKLKSSNARRQPPAARNLRDKHDARHKGAPTVGCTAWLDSPAPSPTPLLSWLPTTPRLSRLLPHTF
jgi:hypothetical protein